MATIQLFLNVIIKGQNHNWYEQLTSALKNYCATERVVIIRQDEAKTAQIEIGYEMSNVSLNQIESIVTDSGASITEINIQLSSSLTGFADPYHASAVSLPLRENLKKIKGVLGGGISSNGEIRFGIEASAINKQFVLDQVLKILPNNIGKS